MHFMKKKHNNAFTLVELLIVTAMLAVISLAIYSTFSSGLKIWQRVSKPIPEEDLGIFFDKFRVDLKNTFKFTGLKFTGSKDSLGFPTLINSNTLQKKTVGQIIYSYDSYAKILNRRQRDINQIYNDKEGIAAQSLVNVESLRFNYYFYDELTKKYLWEEEWEKEKFPRAVRIELEVSNGSGTNKFIRTVSIPVSN